jgi:hypothetical protein
MIVIKKDKVTDGCGLFATQQYNSGDLIRKLEGPIVDKPTRTSIEISEETHIEDKYGIYMNHSFHPSCKIHNGGIVAIKEIKKDDELTFNYNDSETQMACPFTDRNSGESVNGKTNKI